MRSPRIGQRAQIRLTFKRMIKRDARIRREILTQPLEQLGHHLRIALRVLALRQSLSALQQLRPQRGACTRRSSFLRHIKVRLAIYRYNHHILSIWIC